MNAFDPEVFGQLAVETLREACKADQELVREVDALGDDIVTALSALEFETKHRRAVLYRTDLDRAVQQRTSRIQDLARARLSSDPSPLELELVLVGRLATIVADALLRSAQRARAWQ